MWITKAELKTHMAVSSIDVITDNDDTIIDAAIDGAVSECKGYFKSYDADAIFATTGTARHSLLLTFVKDIAVYHLIALSNYKADIEFRTQRYNRAVTWLKGVQKGDIVPDFPLSQSETSGRILYGSNTKREQHY